MSDDDPRFIREMVEIFREQIAEYSKSMPDLLRKKDYDNLSKLAHKAKSSVAVMGMSQVADLLKDLELLANEGKEVGRYEGIIAEFLIQSRQALNELSDL